MRNFLWMLLALPLAAFAQSQNGTKAPDPEDDPFLLKTTVTVTATRDEIELGRSPASTSVVSRREIEARGTQLVDQALTSLEGVYMIRSRGAADANARISIRGFDGPERNLIMIDGQPINDAYSGSVEWSALPIGEVDRLEVVRGPYSTLYGGSAMGGAVNILTRPVSERQLELDGSYGGYRTKRYSLRYSDRFWDRLGLTLGYQRLQMDGYNTRYVDRTFAPGTTGLLVTGAVPALNNTGGATFLVGEQGENWRNQHAGRAKADYTWDSGAVLSVQYMRLDFGYGYDAPFSYLRDQSGSEVFTGPVRVADGGVQYRFTLMPGQYLSGPGGGEGDFFSARYQRQVTAIQPSRACTISPPGT